MRHTFTSSLAFTAAACTLALVPAACSPKTCTGFDVPAPIRAELVEVANFPEHQVTGVAVSPRGRVFVSFPRWGGTYQMAVGELLTVIKPDQDRLLPASPEKLSNALRRLAPALRQSGILVDLSERGNRGRLVTIHRPKLATSSEAARWRRSTWWPSTS